MKLYALDEYDKILISYSGGKDSTALILHMLELGVGRDRIELWHQCVDGRPPHSRPFFDWPSTGGYVRAVAEALGIKLSWQWRAYGFYGELYRKDARSHDIYYQNEGDLLFYHLPTTRGKISTRRKFPQKSASLQRRWCSAALKIDIARRVINNRSDLQGDTEKPVKILWLTGERREESPARAKYNEVENHIGSTKKRVVHHWRAIIDWSESEVWSIIKRHGILPHPAYYLGFPRLSCRSCIFFTKDLWATLADVSPEAIKLIRKVEEDLNFTVDNKYTIDDMVRMGSSRIDDSNREYIIKAVSPWKESVVTDWWKLPVGAFSGNGGGSW